MVQKKEFPVKSSKIGSGEYSDVYHNDDWSVDKVMLNDDNKEDPVDPYSYYIDYLIKHKISRSNPFFPRIYNVHKISKDCEDPRVCQYSYQIEKLFHLSKLGMKSIQSVINNIGISFNSTNKNLLINNFVFTINLVIEGSYDGKPINNEKFLEAISILKKIMNKYTFNENIQWDIHANNLMVRLGPTGGQLVFTDPFSYYDGQ